MSRTRETLLFTMKPTFSTILPSLTVLTVFLVKRTICGDAIGGGGIGGGGIGGGANTYIQFILASSGDKFSITKANQFQQFVGEEKPPSSTVSSTLIGSLPSSTTTKPDKDDGVKKPFKNFTKGAFGGKNYQVVLDPKFNWNGAKEACSNLGMDLASILTLQERNYLVNLLIESGIGEDYKESSVFVGGRRSGSKFTWLDQDKPIENFIWSTGEPNNSGGVEDCVSFWMHQIVRGESGGNDIPCDHPHSLVCKSRT